MSGIAMHFVVIWLVLILFTYIYGFLRGGEPRRLCLSYSVLFSVIAFGSILVAAKVIPSGLIIVDVFGIALQALILILILPVWRSNAIR